MGDGMIIRQIFREIRLLVGNEGGFVHKSFIGRAIGGAVKGFVTGGPTGALAGGIRSLTGTARPTVPRTQTARVTQTSQREKEHGQRLKFPELGTTGARALHGGRGGRIGEVIHTVFNGNGRSGDQRFPGIVNGGGNGRCEPGFVWSPRLGTCLAADSPVAAGFRATEPVMGQYGAGFVPASQIVDRAVCNRGQQLGNDGVCYAKAAISNKQRMWPAGRKPLLSGGDMRAISTAARAGRRMELATKRLQRMGMMKKPSPRRQATLAGHRATLVHDSKH